MKEDSKRVIYWLLAAVVIIGSFLLIMFNGNSQPVDPDNPNAVYVPEFTEGEWMKGNPEAAVTLIEYSDFQCPACRSSAPMARNVAQEFSNHLKLVYRHFPLTRIHDNALVTAQAAEAAGLQGKFWEMHDMIFDKQGEWSKVSTGEAATMLTGYASEIGLDVDKFKEDLVSKEVKDAVQEDMDGALDADLPGTPSFILNGEKLSPKSYEDFRSLIRTAVDEATKV